MLYFNDSSSFVEKFILRALIEFLNHFKFRSGNKMSDLFLKVPIHSNSVLVLLTLNPNILEANA